MEYTDMWVAGIKAKDLIENIESNGGLDVNHLRHLWKADGCPGSFKAYAIKLIRYNFSCSTYIAKKVAEHFNID